MGTNYRPIQKRIIEKNKITCARTECKERPVSLFMRFCNYHTEIHRRLWLVEAACKVPNCKDKTASVLFNFCRDHTAEGMKLIGVERKRSKQL